MASQSRPDRQEQRGSRRGGSTWGGSTCGEIGGPHLCQAASTTSTTETAGATTTSTTETAAATTAETGASSRQHRLCGHNRGGLDGGGEQGTESREDQRFRPGASQGGREHVPQVEGVGQAGAVFEPPL